jgi:DNA polymerase-3 subunit delta'
MPFRDVSGHRRIVDLLKRSIAGGTLPPSLIFSGPAGSGKRLTAIALAQAVNCLQGSEFKVQGSGFAGFDACGTCAICTRIAKGVHPDVLIVEPGDTGAIKIDQIRDAVERAAYRPFEGRNRVVIVDDADTLVVAAQNALLKTLEEPPPSSIFILVTARPDVLLPTVRSRCIRLTFAAGARDEVDAEARDVAGRILAQASASPDPGRRLESAKDLLGNGDRDQVVAHLRAIASLLRDVEVVATGADPRVLANGDMTPAIERLAPAFKGDRGVQAFAAVDRALAALDRNAGVKVVADWLVLQL